MPILDHFSEPVPLRRRWESFHSYWAVELGSFLNALLPPRFFAAVQQHHGSRIEADVLEVDPHIVEVATTVHRDTQSSERHPRGSQSLTPGLENFSPPPATGTFSAVFPDEVTIPVFDVEDSEKLVGVIEIVSPSNKHDPASRKTFAGKCASYLANGIGLIVVDLVHDMHFNLHDGLIDLLEQPVECSMASSTSVYAAAYRPIRRAPANQIDFWTAELAIGKSLPKLPFALKAWGCIPVDLEETYMAVCRKNRLV